ncbi:hypothetical protein [Azospirillum sp. TSO22-1]|uniref:hypothetical protein n=1 Tax=Azospirillum sp. TSO22-1 TaxID=716789 RepID=UPI000D603773|nr:hypothetical protein [Azospirillum sp. TSO22-1]PWC53031.1 hypothetical protein TSO221_12005 [Azospirillum sp. TSO22-1]
MVDTPTMSLRVPHDADMRKALREAARALRQGQITAEALLAWLASRPAHDQGLTERVTAIEERLATLETTVERLLPAQARDLFRHAVKVE